MEPASCWLAGPHHKAAGYRNLMDPGLVLAHWWAEPGSEVGGCMASVPRSSVGLLVGGAGS